jgi:hypothetical protein
MTLWNATEALQQFGLPTAPLASGLRGAGGGAVDSPASTR